MRWLEWILRWLNMVEWLHQIIPNELKHKNRNHQPRTSKSWHRARVGVPIHTLQPSQKTSPKVTPACWWYWCTILEGPKRLMKSIRTTSRHNTILAAGWTNPFVRSYYVWLYSQIGSFSEVGVKILFKKKHVLKLSPSIPADKLRRDTYQVSETIFITWAAALTRW